MYHANEAKVLSMIGPDDVVLDVGGGARCFNRANYVMDWVPYNLRGIHYKQYMNLDGQGGEVEHFNADTWIHRDICSHEPFPFADKSIDFCICSHTLEDIRDPLWVCHEMNRVAKRGYIEIPSRLLESCRNQNPGVPVGVGHHRWLIEVEGNRIAFLPKCHEIHGNPLLSFPESYGRSLPQDRLATWLFWEGGFEYHEGSIHQEAYQRGTEAEMAAFIRLHRPYPDLEPADTEALARTRADYLATIDAILDRSARPSSERVDPASTPLRGPNRSWSGLSRLLARR